MDRINLMGTLRIRSNIELGFGRKCSEDRLWCNKLIDSVWSCYIVLHGVACFITFGRVPYQQQSWLMKKQSVVMLSFLPLLCFLLATVSSSLIDHSPIPIIAPVLVFQAQYGGSIAQWLVYLLPDPVATCLIPMPWVWFPAFPIVNVAEVNQQLCLWESVQWLKNIDRTYLVLASGKLVLQINSVQSL